MKTETDRPISILGCAIYLRYLSFQPKSNKNQTTVIEVCNNVI